MEGDRKISNNDMASQTVKTPEQSGVNGSQRVNRGDSRLTVTEFTCSDQPQSESAVEAINYLSILESNNVFDMRESLRSTSQSAHTQRTHTALIQLSYSSHSSHTARTQLAHNGLAPVCPTPQASKSCLIDGAKLR